MEICALSEMKALPPLPRFVFVNSDEEEDDDAWLEVTARDFTISEE
jgi:hypothetical protein